MGGTMEERKVTVTSNGVEVPMHPFVKDMVESVVLGLIKPLKKTEVEGEIVIRIGPLKP
jgi:hypothetical protein